MFALLLTFSDDPARLELRPAHRERLAALAGDGRLLAAGPWSDDSGALVLLTVDSRAEAEEIVAADPYYAAPGVAVEIREWNAPTRASVLAGL
jgi:uncharacterized protein YciI